MKRGRLLDSYRDMQLLRGASLCLRNPLFPSTSMPLCFTLSSFQLNCSLSTSVPPLLAAGESTSPPIQSVPANQIDRWKPLCLYHAQGKCTKIEDAVHTSQFSHNWCSGLGFDGVKLKNLQPQEHDFFLVLDLEGKVEILEFPVMLFDAKAMKVIDVFHRFVRPTKMTDQRISEYIEGKYGEIGIDRVWHDTAIPFAEVVQEFEEWLLMHHLWVKGSGGELNKAAFVTCGNWDLKTKVPDQCSLSRMKVPTYFREWINLKDVYLNFYKTEARGMISMLRGICLPLLGSHHLGMDDTRNITRVLYHMLADGALMQITARRLPGAPDKVKFLFENRIR